MNLIKKHKLNLLFLIIGLCLGLFIMSFNIKDNNVLLSNGEMPLINFNEDNITSDEYYKILKESSGIEMLLELIDEKLLSKKYTLSDSDMTKIKEQMNDTIKLYSEYYDISEKDFLNDSGFKDKDDFLNFLILEEMRTLYEKDYLKKKITNNEVNNYYINKMHNDFEIMYIKGDNNTLEEILTKLNNGLTYNEIIKNYKNITYKNLGYISFDDEEINSDIYSDAEALDENTYTTSLRSIDNEYYIIFKGKIKEKDSVDTLKTRIINKIVENKIGEDENNLLYKEALINLRRENNISFTDTYLENLYKTYLKNN